jgi:NADPH2:quinone reductase
MKAIQISEFGGPEVLKVRDLPKPKPGQDEILVRLQAIGVNFIDTYQRTGLYPVDLPYVPGLEGSGTVEKKGEGVKDFKVGDRVAYTGIAGAYAEFSTIPAERAIRLPEELDFQQGAAVLLQGMTAHYLASTTYPLKKGDSCLIHAAAGGVGLLLVQIAKMRAATVYATVSTDEKARLAREAGADEVILYTKADFEADIKRLTGGQGVNVVYDSVGKTTFEKSLGCLKPLGYMVSFGQSSGKMDEIDPAILGAKGSLFLTRPSLFHYIADRESLLIRAKEVLAWVISGKLKLHIGRSFSLSEAETAHRTLEGRKTTGKVLLIP